MREPRPLEPKRYRARVAYVIDGDMIILKDTGTRLRLWGINAADRGLTFRCINQDFEHCRSGVFVGNYRKPKVPCFWRELRTTSAESPPLAPFCSLSPASNPSLFYC